MERPYIFFHTGAALCVAVLILPVMGYVFGTVLEFVPEIWILQYLAAVGICGSILWIPFWLDYRLIKKKRFNQK